MPSDSTDPVLALECPHCGGSEAKLCVTSATVITVKCLTCAHMWATDLTEVPEPIRDQLRPTY